MKSEIIEKLTFLISSAKEKNTEQGVKVFNFYIEQLTSADSEQLVYKNLYRELSSMQRFANFNNQEWQAVKFIFNTIEANR